MQFFNDKSNEVFSQYIDRDIINSLSVFLKSSKIQDLEKSSKTIAQAFGSAKEFTTLVSQNDTEKDEAEAKLLKSFHNNLQLLVQKTWVEKNDETVKDQLLDQLELICTDLANKNYTQTYSSMLSVLSDAVYLMFGSSVKKEDFAEYALRIDPDFGTFWWYLQSLPQEQDWNTNKIRMALLLGMCFIANY